MFYNSVVSLINERTMLIYVPRLVSILFIILQFLGMLVYPGGTIHDIETSGYSFTSNFFSDMGAYAARNGEPNYLSMILFSLSLTLVGVTFAFYYFVLPKIMGKNKIFIACDSSNVSRVKEIIKNTQNTQIKIGYKFGLEFLNSKKGRNFQAISTITQT